MQTKKKCVPVNVNVNRKKNRSTQKVCPSKCVFSSHLFTTGYKSPVVLPRQSAYMFVPTYQRFFQSRMEPPNTYSLRVHQNAINPRVHLTQNLENVCCVKSSRCVKPLCQAVRQAVRQVKSLCHVVTSSCNVKSSCCV